jgi:hypothetical protein
MIKVKFCFDNPQTSLDIALTGKMSSNCTGDKCDVNLKSSMNVAPKKGYTSNPVDVNCQRDYTLCKYDWHSEMTQSDFKK